MNTLKPFLLRLCKLYCYLYFWFLLHTHTHKNIHTKQQQQQLINFIKFKLIYGNHKYTSCAKHKHYNQQHNNLEEKRKKGRKWNGNTERRIAEKKTVTLIHCNAKNYKFLTIS